MKRKILGLVAVASFSVWVTACTNSTDDKAANDTTSKSTATTETTTSTGNYAAKSATIEKESKEGYYLNPKTGKPYTSLRMDTMTGRVTTEGGEPVWRYVDKRTWWVYGGNNWDTIGHAKMEKDKLMYENETGKWVPYEERWKAEDESMMNMNNATTTDTSNMTNDQNMNQKQKTKIKTNEKGETKVKTKTKD